ncbi:alcohol acyltransferase 9 [Salvia divinorum]|uniref:Alcohol acyltransferase 9 n=1 Tax=Salvia divinorum TaxID=28513 RepID=A0ABD1FX35_SALDI
MASNVIVTEANFITPSEPTPNHILRLSTLDSKLFACFIYEYLFIYEPLHGVDQDAITENVKAALSLALVPYYPLAGKVQVQNESPGLEVECSGQGILFIRAAASTCTTSEFDSAPRHIMQWKRFLSLQVTDVLSGAPPVVMQLTWLHDGGAALAVGFNHCLIDGTGSAQFLNSSAGLPRWTRARAEADLEPSLIRPNPDRAS